MIGIQKHHGTPTVHYCIAAMPLAVSPSPLSVRQRPPPSLAAFAVRSPVICFHSAEMELSIGPASARRTLLDRVSLFLEPSSIVARIREQVGDEEVILGLSGGVDSSVAAALIHRAIGDQTAEDRKVFFFLRQHGLEGRRGVGPAPADQRHRSQRPLGCLGPERRRDPKLLPVEGEQANRRHHFWSANTEPRAHVREQARRTRAAAEATEPRAMTKPCPLNANRKNSLKTRCCFRAA